MKKIDHKRMQFLGKYDNIEFYKYSPSLFKPYYMDYPIQNHPYYEHRIVHKIRMILEYIRGGYNVFYMLYNNEVVGHLVVANGGRRLAISNKDDIVIGPIFVSPDMRGKGIGTIGINTVLNNLGLNYKYAYEFIIFNNVASIRTVEKNGYDFMCRAKETKILKNIIEDPKGNYYIYRYSKKYS